MSGVLGRMGSGPRRRMAAVAVLAALLAACFAWPAAAHAADGRIMGEVNVKAPGDAAWARGTDAFPSQWVDWRVRIYLPSGVQRYGAVDVRAEVFSDSIAEVDASSIRASVAGADVAPAAVDFPDGGAAGFTVELEDVYSAEGAYDGCEAAVEFKARGSGARDHAGRICSTCSATLSFAAGGEGGARGNATVTGGNCYSYTLSIGAVDAATGEALPGAAYAVRVLSNAGDPSLAGKYVGAGGTLSDDPVEVADAGGGKALVDGVDGGTYSVEQVVAPAGHSAAPAFELEVRPTVNAAKGLVSALEAVASGEASVESTSTVTGEVDVAVPSGAGLALPVTGAAGRPMLEAGPAALAGAAALAFSLAAAGVRRRVPGTRQRTGRAGGGGPMGP